MVKKAWIQHAVPAVGFIYSLEERVVSSSSKKVAVSSILVVTIHNMLESELLRCQQLSTQSINNQREKWTTYKLSMKFVLKILGTITYTS